MYIRGGQPIGRLRLINENSQSNPDVRHLIVRLNYLNQNVENNSFPKCA